MSDPVSEHLERLRSGGLATDLRIPLIDSLRPERPFILCVVINAPHWGGLIPTDEELLLLSGYLDYLCSRVWTRPSPDRPFDIDPGINTIVFLKRAVGDWSYRHITWTQGAILWSSPVSDQCYDLAQLLDKIEHMTTNCQDYQATHPDQ